MINLTRKISLSTIISSSKFILGLYGSLAFISYFLIPWIRSDTIFIFRWDEGPYFYINQKIRETGFIPSNLNYINNIPNYIYPDLYLNLNNLQLLLSDKFNIIYGSIALQIILFIGIFLSSLLIFKISLAISRNYKFSVLTGLLFLLLPIISYRMIYLHATFYGNFLGISYLLCFYYYLTKFNIDNQRKHLILAIFFYSTTLFTHQLVFMMSSIILAIDFFVNLYNKKRFKKELIEKTYFFLGVLLIDLGYILKTPIVQKVTNILGITRYEQFGEEMVVKKDTASLPELIPMLILGASLISFFYIISNKKNYKYWTLSIYFAFLIISVILNRININLPAYFRYDTFYIITIPFLLSFFITNVISNKLLKCTVIAIIVCTFALSTSTIENGFYREELESLGIGLNKLDCHNTVSYFRIAPWIPVMSKSNIYFANVDIYNAHQQEMANTALMLSNKSDLNERLNMIKSNKIDCLVYDKNILIVDGIRVKGWEESRYEDLFHIASKKFEDKNVVIFKFI